MKNILEHLRLKNGITQEELAEAVGVSRQTIISIEKEHYNPSIILAFKLSKYFKTSIEEMFIYKEEKNEK